MQKFTIRQLELKGTQWDGRLDERLREFLGEDLIDQRPPGLTVSTPDGLCSVPLGYWVMRWPDGAVLILSPAAHERICYPSPVAVKG